MQIFQNPECTQYATGEVEDVYVRINTPWSGVDSGWDSIGASDGDSFEALAPSSENPDQQYQVYAWVDFISASQSEPYSAGQVVKATLEGGADVTSYTKVFSKP